MQVVVGFLGAMSIRFCADLLAQADEVLDGLGIVWTPDLLQE